MKKKTIMLVILIVILAVANAYQYFNNYYLDSFGYNAVPDQSTAKAIATAVIKANYGEEVLKDKTLDATHEWITGFWRVKAYSVGNPSGDWIEMTAP